MIGGYIAPVIRRMTAGGSARGTRPGYQIAFISLRPALDMYLTPVIGVICFAILLASWFGGVRYFKGIPAGLVAIAVAQLITLGINAGRAELRRH